MTLTTANVCPLLSLLFLCAVLFTTEAQLVIPKIDFTTFDSTVIPPCQPNCDVLAQKNPIDLQRNVTYIVLNSVPSVAKLDLKTNKVQQWHQTGSSAILNCILLKDDNINNGLACISRAEDILQVFIMNGQDLKDDPRVLNVSIAASQAMKKTRVTQGALFQLAGELYALLSNGIERGSVDNVLVRIGPYKNIVGQNGVRNNPIISELGTARRVFNGLVHGNSLVFGTYGADHILTIHTLSQPNNANEINIQKTRVSYNVPGYEDFMSSVAFGNAYINNGVLFAFGNNVTYVIKYSDPISVTPITPGRKLNFSKTLTIVPILTGRTIVHAHVHLGANGKLYYIVMDSLHVLYSMMTIDANNNVTVTTPSDTLYDPTHFCAYSFYEPEEYVPLIVDIEFLTFVKKMYAYPRPVESLPEDLIPSVPVIRSIYDKDTKRVKIYYNSGMVVSGSLRGSTVTIQDGLIANIDRGRDIVMDCFAPDLAHDSSYCASRPIVITDQASNYSLIRVDDATPTFVSPLEYMLLSAARIYMINHADKHIFFYSSLNTISKENRLFWVECTPTDRQCSQQLIIDRSQLPNMTPEKDYPYIYAYRIAEPTLGKFQVTITQYSVTTRERAESSPIDAQDLDGKSAACMETYNGKVYWIFHSFILIHDSGDCTKSIRVKVYQTVDTCVAMQVVHMNGIAYLMIKGHKILYLYNLADVLSNANGAGSGGINPFSQYNAGFYDNIIYSENNNVLFLNVFGTGTARLAFIRNELTIGGTVAVSVFSGVLGGLLLIIILTVLIILIRKLWIYGLEKYNSYKRYQTNNEELRVLLVDMKNEIEREIDETSDVYRWIIKLDQLQFKERIAEGSFGVVFKGVYQGTDVAVKMLKLEDAEDFTHEVRMLASVRHPNLVLFIGVSVSEDHKFIVTEYMAGRSLSYALMKSPEAKKKRALQDGSTPHVVMTFQRKIEILIDVARGMSYMHGLEPKLIHRDLKLGNLLLDQHGMCKICDFGTSKSLSQQGEMTNNVGTLQYMAPEIILNESPYNERADVYSYAIVMWELFYERQAFTSLSDNTNTDSGNMMTLGFEVAKNRLRPAVPDLQSEEYQKYSRAEKVYLDAMMQYWQHEPLLRADFPTIIEQLEKISEIKD